MAKNLYVVVLGSFGKHIYISNTASENKKKIFSLFICFLLYATKVENCYSIGSEVKILL